MRYSMETKIMRIGIMGTLRGGGYVRIFKALEGAKVTAVCDFNPRSLATIQDVLDADKELPCSTISTISSNAAGLMLSCSATIYVSMSPLHSVLWKKGSMFSANVHPH